MNDTLWTPRDENGEDDEEASEAETGAGPDQGPEEVFSSGREEDSSLGAFVAEGGLDGDEECDFAFVVAADAAGGGVDA